MDKVCPFMLVGLQGPSLAAKINPLERRCIGQDCELWVQTALRGGRSGCCLRLATEALVVSAMAAT